MMRLRRVYETAEEEGRPIEEVAIERFDTLERLRRPRRSAEYSTNGMQNGDPKLRSAAEIRKVWGGVVRRGSCSMIFRAVERRVAVRPSVDPAGVGGGQKMSVLHPHLPQLVVLRIAVWTLYEALVDVLVLHWLSNGLHHKLVHPFLQF